MRIQRFLTPLFFVCVVVCANALADEQNSPLRLVNLRELDELVTQYNISLKQTRYLTNVASGAVQIAAARPNPQLGFNSSGVARSPTGTKNMDEILRIDQLIERGDKRDIRVSQANALLGAAQYDEADALRQQRQLARLAFYDLQVAEQRVEIAVKAKQLSDVLVQKAQIRLKAGDISNADLSRIKTDGYRLESDLKANLIALAGSKTELARIIGLEPEAQTLKTQGELQFFETAGTFKPDSFISQRPDVIAAEKRANAAEGGIALARSLKTRDVTVSGQLERNRSLDFSGKLFGVGISIPLLTGNTYEGELQQALAIKEVVDLESQRIRLRAESEAKTLKFQLELAAQRAKALQVHALPAAKKAYSTIEFAFNQGAASTLDVIDARRSLQLVELDTVNAVGDWYKARTNLDAATGTLE